MTARNWCFTLNNYTEDELEHIRENWKLPDVSYYIAGHEVGEEDGTPHLQGYVELGGNSRRLPGAKSVLGIARIHLERRMGTREQAINYTIKEVPEGGLPLLESDITKRGSNDQGSRSDL